MSAIASSSSSAALHVDGKARSLAIAVLLPLVYLLFGVTWLGFVPLLPEVATIVGKDMKTEAADVAFLVIVISWAKSVVPILAGVVAARIGLTNALRIGGALILVGAAAPWLHDWYAAVAVRFVFGIGGAVWVTLMGPVVLATLSPSARPIANAVNGVAVNAGIVLAYAVTLPLAGVLGPQWALTLASVATGAALVGLSLCGKLGELPPPQPVAATLLAYARTLKLPATWILAVAFCGPLALYLMLNTYLAQHLIAAYHLDRAAASHWMTWLNVWALPFSLASGAILTKIGTPKPMLLAVVVVPVGLWLALHAESDTVRAAGFVLVSAGMFLPVSPLVTTVQKMAGMTPQKFGMIIGTMFAVSYIASSAIPSAMGPLLAHGVSLGSMLSAAGVLGLTPLVGLALKRA